MTKERLELTNHNATIRRLQETIAKLDPVPKLSKSFTKISDVLEPRRVKVKQEPSSPIPSKIASSPMLSPTQYSSSQVGSQELIVDSVSPVRDRQSSFSIFHGNIDMDVESQLEESADEVKVVDDSQEDYDELTLETPRKRIPLMDITQIDKLKDLKKLKLNNSGKDLMFDRLTKSVNLSHNIDKDRDWIIEDFMPNPELSDNEYLYTMKRFESDAAGSPRCKCPNCIKFFNLIGEPIDLSRKERLNAMIFKIHHRHGGLNKLQFSIDAPGVNQSEFPNTQESKEHKVKLKRINRIKLFIRLINSLEVSSKGEQCGLYIFRNLRFNDMVKAGTANIDNWIYEELDAFIKDYQGGEL